MKTELCKVTIDLWSSKEQNIMNTWKRTSCEIRHSIFSSNGQNRSSFILATSATICVCACVCVWSSAAQHMTELHIGTIRRLFEWAALLHSPKKTREKFSLTGCETNLRTFKKKQKKQWKQRGERHTHTSEEDTWLWRPEWVITGGYPGEEGVFVGILQTEGLQFCSSLRNL